MTLQTGYVPGLAAFDGANPATATWRFALEDHLGSPRAYLGQSKAAMARFDFSPYGELMRSAGLPLTVGYTGHLWDPALRQYFAPFRHFNPKTARWNMPDPLGMVDGPNVYAYVAGNPVNAIDSLGLLLVAGGIGGGIMGGILGGMDQAGCGFGSIAAGAIIGATTGAITGLFGGLFLGAAMGGLDSYLRGGNVVGGVIGGIIGGAIGDGLDVVAEPFEQFVGGVGAAAHIHVWPRFADSINPHGNDRPCISDVWGF